MSLKQERNIRYKDEQSEVNQIPNRHPSNKKSKCVNAFTTDANIEQNNAKNIIMC